MSIRIAAFITITVVMAATMAFAGPILGTNITVYDKNPLSGSSGEDNETEPGTVQAQIWDLEAFFLKGNTLSIVGGFDFRNGVYVGNPRYHTYTSGDIFFDTNGNANGNTGWDYAVRMDFDHSSQNADGSYTVPYSVWGIDNTTPIVTTFQSPTDIASSTPWKFLDNAIPTTYGGSFTYSSTTADPYEGLNLWPGTPGTSHYTVTGFNLDFLNPGTNFTAHFTMECGNDLLMGQGTTAVPEPGTLLLLGIGITSLAGYTRIARKK
jgi:hypothetical protein